MNFLCCRTRPKEKLLHLGDSAHNLVTKKIPNDQKLPQWRSALDECFTVLYKLLIIITYFTRTPLYFMTVLIV